MMVRISKECRSSFKSDEEYYFNCWLHELMLSGYIESYTYEPLSIVISEVVQVPWVKQLKTKIKKQMHPISKSVTYTPDFLIIWTDKANGLFTYNSQDSYVNRPLFYVDECKHSFIEIKGNFDRNGTDRDTRTKIQWVFDKYNTLITLIKPDKLFKNTFYPEEYLLTKSGKDKRFRKGNTLVPLRDHVRSIQYYYDTNN